MDASETAVTLMRMTHEQLENMISFHSILLQSILSRIHSYIHAHYIKKM